MREARKGLANEKVAYKMAGELDYLFIDSPERNALTQQILRLQRKASRPNNVLLRAEDRKAILMKMLLLFIDFTKAFDTVSRERLWKKLRASKFAEQVVSMFEKATGEFGYSTRRKW